MEFSSNGLVKVQLKYDTPCRLMVLGVRKDANKEFFATTVIVTSLFSESLKWQPLQFDF